MLAYHDVTSFTEESGFPGPLAARYKLEPAGFEEHLDAIAATGADVGLQSPEGRPAAALSFDDGGSSALSIATSLERRGWRGYFFITTAKIGSPGFLDADGIVELARRGHQVGSHSHTHPTYMGRLPSAEIEEEWRTSRALLGDLLRAEVTHASVPGGYVTDEVVAAARRAGYGVLMTSDPVATPRSVGSMTVWGRFAIWAGTPAATAAAYVTGKGYAHARLALEWKLKRTAKRILPRAYDSARALRARRR